MTVNDRAGGAARRGPRLAAGAVLSDRYQVDSFIGPTPYGELYRGRDQQSGALVNLQVLSTRLAGDAAVRARLERQVQIAVQLDHKNIAVTHGLGQANVGGDEVLYLASEAVDGQSLRDMLEKKRSQGKGFSLKGTYNIVAHLCNALAYAHGATIHGGLNPDCVWVNSAGRVKVLDFAFGGVLAPTSPGAGVLPILAPELATGRADGRADVYAVGHLLYHLLTAQPPPSPWQPASALVPGLPAAADDVLARCLQPEPDARFADPLALKEALHAALSADLDAPARPTTSVPIQPEEPNQPQPKPAVAKPPSAPPARPPQKSNPPSPPPAAPKKPAAPAATSAAAAPAARGFDVNAAFSGVDEQSERWLIQKDKLDFGPFSLRDVRAQIEQGKILGEHTIIDTETGERRRVKDHPALRQLAIESEGKMAEQQREAGERAERTKQRGRVVTILAIIMVVVLGVGGGVTWYVLTMKPKTEKVIVHDQENLDFLKDLTINMKVDPPPAKRPGGKKKSGGKNAYSDTTNLGDATGDAGDETLDQNQVQRVMQQNFKVLVGCISEERRRNPSLKTIDMDFTIKGSGQVDGVQVNGSKSSIFANCMFGKMQSVSFPKFNGSKTHANFSLALK
jgi:serine/threonine-protein kinase